MNFLFFDFNLDAAQSGIEVRGLGALTSENVTISNCQFTQLSIGVYSIYDTQTITIKDSLFTFGHVGIDLGRTSSGSGSQAQGPRHYLITNCKFDKIDDFGIAVHAPNNTTPYGHTSSSNMFIDVANNGNGQNSPQTSVIKFDGELCASVGDFFERDAFVNQTSLSAVPFKPTVDGLHYTKSRLKTETLSEVDAPTQIIKLPFTKDKIAYIDYLVVKDGTSSDTTRQGKLTLTVRNDSSINITDNYSHTGTSDGAIEWTAVLDDMDSTSGSETLLVKYRNPIGNGIGTLSYSISYFA